MEVLALIFLGLYYTLSVHGSACAGAENMWMMSQGQSPCDLYQALIRLCLPTWKVDVLSYGQQYASGTSSCGCNTVAASLAAACSDCQTAGTYNGPLHSWYLTAGNDATHWCNPITNGSVGPEVTLPKSLKNQIPSWAWIDINASHGYWSYSESYLAYSDTNSVSVPPPRSTASSSAHPTSSSSEQRTASTSVQTTSSTSEQASSQTLGQATSFLTSTTTYTTTLNSTDTVTDPTTITLPPEQTDTSTITSSLTFTLTETSTRIQDATREPAIQTPASPTPTGTVIANSDSNIGSNAIWAIVGSILGAVASIATIYMCLRLCNGRGGGV